MQHKQPEPGTKVQSGLPGHVIIAIISVLLPSSHMRPQGSIEYENG
jgi:hypothetical protein